MRKIFFFVLVIVLLVSCDRELSEPVVPPVDAAEYLPLQVGNYWVYQYYKIDTLGNETPMSITDSIVVTKDTILNGNHFFALEGTEYLVRGLMWMVIDFLRVSNHTIMNDKNKIRFSTVDFTTVLDSFVSVSQNDTLFSLTYKMEKVPVEVVVPAGRFTALNFRGTVITAHPDRGIKNPRYLNNYYVRNVGKVLETYHYLRNPFTFEKRLIRYHLKINKQ